MHPGTRIRMMGLAFWLRGHHHHHGPDVGTKGGGEARGRPMTAVMFQRAGELVFVLVPPFDAGQNTCGSGRTPRPPGSFLVPVRWMDPWRGRDVSFFEGGIDLFFSSELSSWLPVCVSSSDGGTPIENPDGYPKGSKGRAR